MECPRCNAPVNGAEETTTCRNCHTPLRIIDVPERPCVRCGASVPVLPGQDILCCPACGRAQSDQKLEAQARCPECRRRISVGLDDTQGTCPHCHTAFALTD